MIVACDVDGIVVDLHPEWLRRYNRDYGDNLAPEGCHKWDLAELVKPECGRRIYDYLNDLDLYENCAPVAGSQEGVARIRALGHTLFFVTANTYGMTDQKARWLERYGFCTSHGHNLPADYVPVFNRTWLDAYLLIDDGAHNVIEWVNGKGRPAILLDRPYNAYILNDVPSIFWGKCMRASSWDGIVRHVEGMSR